MSVHIAAARGIGGTRTKQKGAACTARARSIFKRDLAISHTHEHGRFSREVKATLTVWEVPFLNPYYNHQRELRGSITSAFASYLRRSSSNPAAPPSSSLFMNLPHIRVCFWSIQQDSHFAPKSSVCGWRYQAKFQISGGSLSHNCSLFMVISSRIQWLAHY